MEGKRGERSPNKVSICVLHQLSRLDQETLEASVVFVSALMILTIIIKQRQKKGLIRIRLVCMGSGPWIDEAPSMSSGKPTMASSDASGPELFVTLSTIVN